MWLGMVVSFCWNNPAQSALLGERSLSCHLTALRTQNVDYLAPFAGKVWGALCHNHVGRPMPTCHHGTHWAEPGKCCQVSPDPCNGRPVIQNPLLKGLLCACLPWFQWLLPCTRDFSPETCHESPMVALFLSIPGYAEGCHYPLFPSLLLL